MVPPLVVVQLRHARIRLPSQTAGPVGCVAMYLSEDELPLIAWQIPNPSQPSQTLAEGEMPISESKAGDLEPCSSGFCPSGAGSSRECMFPCSMRLRPTLSQHHIKRI